jgi:hypothetical protein
VGTAKHPHDKNRPESAGVRKALEAGDMEALGDVLTYRQRRFCEEYAVDFNGAAAAVRAGYAVKFADRQAHTLLKHKGVIAYVDHLTQSQAAKIMAVDADYIVQGIVNIIAKAEGKDGDKLRGYELLARLKGLFIDKQEITGRDGGAIEVEQRRIDEESDSFLNMLKAMTKKPTTDKKVITVV